MSRRELVLFPLLAEFELDTCRGGHVGLYFGGPDGDS